MIHALSRRQFLSAATLAAGGTLLLMKETAGQSSTDRLMMRKEIRSLGSDLEKLRIAFRELKAKTGQGSYGQIAGIHGYPDFKCEHYTNLFLPWHRAYILSLEQALQKVDSSVSLPFWDWTSDESISSGLPREFADRKCIISGDMVDNPLYSATNLRTGRQTVRYPQDPYALNSIKSGVLRAFTNTDYEQFNIRLEIPPHDNLHSWVGGDMGRQTDSAFDPIFWAHHANVDRQWAQWQIGANNDDPSPSIQAQMLDPFGLTVKQVLDRKKLGYDYEGLTPMPTLPIAIKDSPITVKSVRLPANVGNLTLQIHGLRASEDSFFVNVFINQSDADHKTKLKDNPHYAGSFGIFGTGKKGHRHQDPPKSVPVLDISTTVRSLFPKDKVVDLQIKLVATDNEGKPIDASKLPITGVSIQEK